MHAHSEFKIGFDHF